MTINFYNDITESDLQYIEQIKALTADDELIINFNSAGGLCNVGMHLYNVIKTSPAKTVGVVEGFCASIASYILMACKERVGYANSIIMIHRPLCHTVGNAEELKKQATTLSVYASALESAYIENSKLEEEEIKTMLDNETYLTAEEALNIGFLTVLEGDLAMNSKSTITAKALRDIIMKANLKFNQQAEIKNMDIQIEKIEDVISILTEMSKYLNEEYIEQINAIVEFLSKPQEEATEETVEEPVENISEEKEEEKPEEESVEVVEEKTEEEKTEEEKTEEEKTEEEKQEEVVENSESEIEELKKQLEELKTQIAEYSKPMNIGTFTVINKDVEYNLTPREIFNKLSVEDKTKADLYWKANKRLILQR